MPNTTQRITPSNLPDVKFVDTDTETVMNTLISSYQTMTGRTLYPADPVRIFISWLASIIVQERELINESAKQNLPRFATGENLDSISEIFHNVSRLEPTSATTTLMFTISTTLDYDYVITDEIEVTVDGNINFLVKGEIKFKAGQTTAIVEAVCTTTGIVGNGFLPGQITSLITMEFLYFESVTNITESAGGSERESDEAFYNRMRESEETYTTAGPRTSYSYHAKSVSTQISDVSAECSEDGVVDIRIMLYDGNLPPQELLDKVSSHLNSNDIRPMTDKVIVSAPITVKFDIEAKYYIDSNTDKSISDIAELVEKAKQEYISWQTEKMGRDINPSYFNSIMMSTGIKRIEIIKPQFAKVDKGCVAVLDNCNIVYGGQEE